MFNTKPPIWCQVPALIIAKLLGKTLSIYSFAVKNAPSQNLKESSMEASSKHDQIRSTKLVDLSSYFIHVASENGQEVRQSRGLGLPSCSAKATDWAHSQGFSKMGFNLDLWGSKFAKKKVSSDSNFGQASCGAYSVVLRRLSSLGPMLYLYIILYRLCWADVWPLTRKNNPRIVYVRRNFDVFWCILQVFSSSPFATHIFRRTFDGGFCYVMIGRTELVFLFRVAPIRFKDV